DLVRIDVGAAPDDDVLQAARHVQEAVLVEKAEVAQVGPAIGRVRPRVLAPEPLLHRRAPHADLAVLRDQALDTVVRSPHAVPALLDRVRGRADRQLAGVHGAVEGDDAGAGARLPGPRHL